MPSFCAVLDCNDKYGHGQNVPFHKFPTKRKELLERWMEFTQRPNDWKPSKWMSVCGLHFRDEDYRCSEQKKLLKKNAVPSVRTAQYSNTTRNASTNASKAFNSGESEEEETSNCDMDQSANKNEQIDSNCRFCGFTSSNFVSFFGNFEIFGMIQKCLPTLSIHQDDNMPKEICRNCLKRLKNFALFIDKVLETQAALQCQFRIEKGTTKPNERILKIKQEPVVRVKQENLDDVNAFFPDEVDDGCGEQEHYVSNAESQMDQKFQFCDFPVLNDQDIINNCDIMEIINLSEPFIDITNCENTIAEEESQLQQQFLDNRSRKQQTLPSAHELLQSHLLTEEHNYANLAEDFKEEWPIRHSYKTEKIEADECEPNNSVESTWIDDIVQDMSASLPEDDADIAATMTVTTTLPEDEFTRSAKPIVTSVSSFNEATMLPLTQAASSSNIEGHTTSRKKPNIVVLNESIVQSSHALQFQACTICQSKFFSIDSLNHHYGVTHGLQVTPSNHAIQPMVIVPSSNITIWDKGPNKNSELGCHSYKTEKDICFESKQIESNTIISSADDSKTNVLTKRSSKNEIKILDMQQTFLQHQYHYPNQHHIEQHATYCQTHEHTETENRKTQQSEHNSFALNDEMHHIATNLSAKKKSPLDTDPQLLMPFDTNALSADTKSGIVYETFTAEAARDSNNGNFEKIANKYLELQKRFRRLKQKCCSLVQNHTQKKQHSMKNSFRCRICPAEFSTFFQLLRHKQSTPSHYIRKPAPNLSSSCAGCEKIFCRKIALNNHMRYICPSLPLRWLKNQIRTFKCRYCRRITFTHWRLCRKHELKCRYHKKQKMEYKNAKHKSPKSYNIKSKLSLKTSSKKRISKSESSQSHASIRKPKPHVCDQCKKVYPSLSSLNQHRITHTSLRVHQCEICHRVFKRRNGLTQHVRGFHMKIKPYECPTCKHSYALRGDMRRCKHSVLSRTAGGEEKKHIHAL